MNNFYFNLSGGINQSSTKTELGMDTKNIYWADAENIEIYQSKGIIKQKGNLLIKQIPNNEKIIGLHEMKKGDSKNLIIITVSGKIYILKNNTDLILLDKVLHSDEVICTNYLNGTLIAGNKD